MLLHYIKSWLCLIKCWIKISIASLENRRNMYFKDMGIYNSSFNNILFISYWSILLLGFAQKPSTCCKSLTNIITPPVGCYQFHNFSVDMYWLQGLIKIQQHGHSGDGHWFDGKMQIQLTFDHSQFYFLLSFWEIKGISYNLWTSLLSLPNNVWRLIVFAPFLIIIIILFLSFRGPWTCPRQILGTTGQNFMKLGGVIDICF